MRTLKDNAMRIILINILFLFTVSINSQVPFMMVEEKMLDSIDMGGYYIYPMKYDIGNYEWGGYETEITDGNGAESDIDGEANTLAIVSQLGSDGHAAYACDTLTAYGYNDWYLPSIVELDSLYKNKGEIGGFNSGYYWSSTDQDALSAWGLDYYYYLKNHILGKTESRNVRCIRNDTFVPTESLITYYDFNGNIEDKKNNYDGTPQNITYTQTSKEGKAASFNGVDSYIDMPGTPLQQSSTEGTICVWVYPQNINGNVMIFWTEENRDRGLRYDYNNDNYEGSMYFGAHRILSGGSLSGWTHLALTYDLDSGIKLYVNGELKDTYSGSTTDAANNTPTYIGHPNPGTDGFQGDYFEGYMDEFRVYDTQLSSSEVKLIYNNTK